MKKYTAYSLIEMLIAIGIFGLMVSSIVLVSFDIFSTTSDYQQKVNADIYREKIYREISVIKEKSWGEILSNSNGSAKHIVENAGTYTISNGPISIGDIAYSFTISDVQRDGSGNITSSGTIDPHTKKVEINFTWTDKLGRPKDYASTIYLNDWHSLAWTQTTQADFNAGSHFQTLSTNTSGGEVSLLQVFYPDWCKPALALDTYDIPGNATAKTLFSFPSKTYLGTGGNATGNALTKLNITGVENPSISVEGVFNGYLTNNIFVSGNYAYLATTQNDKEVVILDVSSTPYTEVGYFNTSRTEDANSVFVVGNTGYVAAGRYVFTFDLAQKTGSRTQLGLKQVSLNQNLFQTAAVSQIVVKDSYLYASLDQDLYELAIVNISNPANMTITSQTSVNNQQTLDVYVNNAGTRVYFGTSNSNSEREFFIIDTSNKNGARPTISSYDTNGMSIKGIAIVEADNRAILVGTGAEEYQVIDISAENTPTRCGGMQINSGINDIDAVTDSDTNSFSYILTNDTTHDFQILRGGPGIGGGETGFGYLPNGEYTSQVLDTTSTTASYFFLSWDDQIPTGGSVKFQVRSGTTSNLSASPFIGPDGTSSTFFTTSAGSVLPTSLNNKRYIQFKAFFTSNTLSTPFLKSVTLNYAK